MNNEKLWEGWDLALSEVDEEQPSLPPTTEVHISPEKADGSIFIYYRHPLTEGLEKRDYWSSILNPGHKETVAALLYQDALVWTNDQHCADVRDLLKARDDSDRSKVAMLSKHVHDAKTGMDYRFIDIWFGAWESHAGGQLASFLARNVQSDEVQMRVISIHPENILPEDKNQKLFFGTMRKFRSTHPSVENYK